MEYYDGIANIGISSEVFLGATILMYNYYMTEEFIVYDASKIFIFKLFTI
jgi:hypothetical protein